MKTFVLTFSKKFPSHHTRKGEATNFIDKLLTKTKTTTIRGNEKRWRKIRREVNEGRAFLSLRYWSDKPYRSKQVEFARVYEMATHRVFITNSHNGFEMSINGVCSDNCAINHIVKREGFDTEADFTDWFTAEEFSGVMIELFEIETVI